ncbi:MAG: methyltransferase domain-containing protein [Planctomycetota bacterium]
MHKRNEDEFLTAPKQQTTWTKEQVTELLEKELFEFQRFELPYGLATPGRDRSATANAILPKDMTGKTYLDVGCYQGFFVIEAMRRGATRAVGYDIDPENIRKARLLADCCGVNAEFEVLDLSRDAIEAKFDVVSCLNVLHHVGNPLLALEKLVSVSRETLAIEICSITPRERRRLGMSKLRGWFLNREPIIYVNPAIMDKNPLVKAKVLDQKFYITNAALENLLRDHHTQFARVETLPPTFKERSITLAHRRRIDELTVFVAPLPDDAKSFAAAAMSGAAPGVAKAAGLLGGKDRRVLSLNELHDSGEVSMPKAFVHGSFLRHLGHSDGAGPFRHEVLDCIDSAKNTTQLLLWLPPEEIQRRSRDHVARRSKDLAEDGRYGGSVQHDLNFYFNSEERVRQRYREWIAASEKQGVETLVVRAADWKIMTPDEWDSSARPG